MRAKYHVLILGASYGSLLGTKLLLAGHAVTLVCTRTTAELINREGTLVRLPVRGRPAPLAISSKTLDAELSACAPEAVNPGDFDLAVLAMQESHYASDSVRELMQRLAAARVPCLAIMNMPPLPFLKRIPAVATERLTTCYRDVGVWRAFDPGLMTLASPDPQAFRPPEEGKNVLQIGLATNFKVAPFAAEARTAMLRRLQADIEAIRFDPGDGAIELPVKLKVHDSLFVPLAKWAMLLTGNYRCIRRDKMISIKEAVRGDIDASREMYNWVAGICLGLGAAETDLVPFEKYAQAAQGLLKPSSAARALSEGDQRIEDSRIRVVVGDPLRVARMFSGLLTAGEVDRYVDAVREGKSVLALNVADDAEAAKAASVIKEVSAEIERAPANWAPAEAREGHPGDPTATLSLPQVYPLPHAPTDWNEATLGEKSAIDVLTDPARPDGLIEDAGGLGTDDVRDVYADRKAGPAREGRDEQLTKRPVRRPRPRRRKT